MTYKTPVKIILRINSYYYYQYYYYYYQYYYYYYTTITTTTTTSTTTTTKDTIVNYNGGIYIDNPRITVSYS